MYADLTTENRSFLKRFSHGTRFKIALELLDPQSGDEILDYGTGDGYMLSKIRESNDQCRIVGYEPVPEMFEELRAKITASIETQSLEIVKETGEFSSVFNKICCLEVLEHLTEENQCKELTEMARLLTDEGRLLISVPIEVGVSSLLKNSARIVLGQTHGKTTFRNVFYSLFGIPFDRGDEDYNPSHLGFYYPALEKLFPSVGLRVRKKVFSPMPILKGIVNSQVFFLLEKA